MFFSVCPDGFVYIGDDETRARDIVFEVLDETEPYSCYKIMDEPMNYLDARDACGELNIKAKVLTLDGLHEAERFTREFNETLGSSQSYLTSALHYEKGWHWMGASMFLKKLSLSYSKSRKIQFSQSISELDS